MDRQLPPGGIVLGLTVMVPFWCLIGACAAPGVETQASRDRLNCEYAARYDAAGSPRSIADTSRMLQGCGR